MKFDTNPAPSPVPADWLDRVNPFLSADDPDQPVRLDDGRVVPAIRPETPCTKECCREEP